MSELTVTLYRADGESLPYVEALLEGADLPADDLRSDPVRLYVARDDTDRVGVGGFEVHGDDALLRSVVVEPDERGNGTGTAIVDALETAAGESGVERSTCSRRRRQASSPRWGTSESTARTRPTPSGRPASSPTSARRRRRVSGSHCSRSRRRTTVPNERSAASERSVQPPDCAAKNGER